MTRDDALITIKAVLASIAPEVDLDATTDDTDLQADLDLDSMDCLNLVIGVHERTGIDIPERDYPQLATLGGFADYLAAAAART